MTDIAIRVEHLGKRYRIGGKRQRYGRFTEALMDTVTEPTEGRVELRGRVGSQLEVGAAFHPELTGRHPPAGSGHS